MVFRKSWLLPIIWHGENKELRAGCTGFYVRIEVNEYTKRGCSGVEEGHGRSL